MNFNLRDDFNKLIVQKLNRAQQSTSFAYILKMHVVQNFT